MSGTAMAGGTSPPRTVDLHLHSTASDGVLAPADVVEAARGAGLAAIALTDHDTLAGLPEAQEAGDRLGVRVVPGVELSALDGQREVHLLGLHIARVPEIERHLAIFRDTRRTRAEQIVAKLNALGVPVRLDAVLAGASDGAIGRPHIARALVAGGWASDARDAFDRFLGNGRPAFVPKHRLLLADAVQIVHRAGGLAVFAHPSHEGSVKRLEAMAAAGIDGVEVLHPSHTSEDAARIGAIADHLHLVPSGGSDWHGGSDGPRMIGGMHVPFAWLERQEALLRDRATRERVA